MLLRQRRHVVVRRRRVVRPWRWSVHACGIQILHSASRLHRRLYIPYISRILGGVMLFTEQLVVCKPRSGRH